MARNTRNHAKRNRRKPKRPPGYVKPTTSGISTEQATKWATTTLCKTKHWRMPFSLDHGLTVYLSARRDCVTIGYHGIEPTLGFYLDEWWIDGAVASGGIMIPGMDKKRYVYVPWPDYSIPDGSVRTLAEQFRWLLHQVKTGELVEIGCIGGHGRTGSVAAALLVVQGVPAAEALARVRSTYCVEAVETNTQERLLYRLDEIVNGRSYTYTDKPDLTRWPDDKEYDAGWTEWKPSGHWWEDDDLEKGVDKVMTAMGMGYAQFDAYSDCIDGPGVCPNVGSCEDACLREWLFAMEKKGEI